MGEKSPKEMGESILNIIEGSTLEVQQETFALVFGKLEDLRKQRIEEAEKILEVAKMEFDKTPRL